MKKIFLFLWCLTNLHLVFGQAGTIDASFAPPLDINAYTAIALEPAGTILAATAVPNSSGQFFVRRFSTSGALLTTIGPLNDAVNTIYVRENGDIYISGFFTNFMGKNKVARLTSAGTVVSSFTFPVTIPNNVSIHRQKGITGLNSLIVWGNESGNIFRANLDTGAIDNSFVQGTYSGTFPVLSTVDSYANGQLILGGQFTSYNGVSTPKGLVKLSSTGGVLYNYASLNLTQNGDGWGVRAKIDINSNILLSYFPYSDPVNAYTIVRILNTTNNTDPSFSVTFDNYGALSILEQQDGKIIVAGLFEHCQQVSRNSIARLQANGTLDICFAPAPGVGPANYQQGIGYIGQAILDNNGNIYICGDFASYDGVTRPGLAKVYANTTNTINAVDDSGTIAYGIEDTVIANVLANDVYNGNTPTTSSVTLSLVSAPAGISMTAAGEVYVDSPLAAGTYTLIYSICAGTCPCDTATVTITIEQPVLETVNDSFLPTCVNGLNGGVVGDVTANDLMNGEIVDDNLITITLTDNAGIANATLNQAGVLSIPMGTPAGSYEIQYKICVAGTTNCVTGRARFCVNQILNTGSGPNNVIYDIKVQPNGYIVIGGAFTTYNGVPRNRIARLKPDLTLDTTFDPSGIGFNGTVYSVALQGSNILVGGSFTARTDGTPKKHLARLTSTGALDTSFTNHTFNSVNASSVRIIKLTPDNNIMVGGGFDNMDALTGTASIVKLNSSGNIVSGFVSPYSSNTSGVVFDIFIYTNASMLLGSSAIVLSQNGYTRFLVKVNSSGVIDPNFTTGYFPTLSGYVTSITANLAGKIIVGGIFDNYNYSGRNNLVQLTSAGVFDSGAPINTGSGFGTSGFSNGPVYSLASDSSNKLYVGGNFSSYNGNSVNKLFRLDSTGNFDGTFSAGTGFNGPVHKVIMQPTDGKILTGGNFTTYNGNTAKFITRLLPVYNNTAVQGRLMAPGLSDKNVVIYPNPSEGIFNIDLSGYDDVNFDITVHNTLGQVIYRGNISSQNTNQVDLTPFQAGNYFITLQNSYETINKVVTVK